MDDVSFARLEWEARSVESLSECMARINDSVSSDAYLYLERKYESHFARTALSATAVVASVLYALACAWAMYKQRVSRRFYTLIFNRVGADLLISTNQLLIDLVRLIGYCGLDCIIYAIFNPFVMLFLMLYGLLTTAVTYMALLLIKLTVAGPEDARGGVPPPVLLFIGIAILGLKEN
ncbi:hypothetical protein Ddc_11132 [Ditylenchus destructor]|nr:hypothetical protein Ddc_11132 [Ditylenchus destructor]